MREAEARTLTLSIDTILSPIVNFLLVETEEDDCDTELEDCVVETDEELDERGTED